MNKLVSIFLSLALLITVSCSSDDPEDAGPPPEIPPSETMEMDFSDFNEGGRVAAINYWLRSAAHVGTWNLILTVGLAVPVTAFKASFAQTPTFTDGRWVWSYDVIVNQITYTADLHGYFLSDGVKWEMYVSRQNGFSDFLWFEGTSALDGQSGEWTLYNNSVENKAILFIDWNRSTDGTVADIKYTNEDGGYIQYGLLSTDPDYNRFYDIVINNSIMIKWHRDKKNGQIIDATFYGDAEPRCWDTTLNDADCPS